ncbi:4'-phosphopantetheinyl transferase superfamily protein [Streptomyces sp. ACA25]|uniref:4'-phosphopantetheinyl transferase family protein n=1 Tax=Streptomyces sp. ACA25 TaxID=3022596 RepID=UPI0023081C1D|nr:4'-phosphopantetheinyl transferase superfamily protein [Streptomyces sp. ACA25]MDB1085987.1 4'-phosphopantetheinyl transferase superfamily protein [Streptomyces sp. ACA25]
MPAPPATAGPQTAAPGYRAGGLPTGPPAGTDVWLIGLDTGSDPGTGCLGPAERRRAEAFPDPVAARRYTRAHSTVRTILGSYLDRDGRALRWSTEPHGKPVFDGRLSRWQWNLSRSGGHALLAVSLTAPVGVDIEQVRVPAGAALALAARFLPDEEAAQVAAQPGPQARRAAYHRLLSRKEACVKAAGGRLLTGLGIPVPVPGTVLGSRTYRGTLWTLTDLPAPPGYVAAVAAVGTARRPLRLRTWDSALPTTEPAHDSEGPR